jgi:inositol oxygenase
MIERSRSRYYRRCLKMLQLKRFFYFFVFSCSVRFDYVHIIMVNQTENGSILQAACVPGAGKKEEEFCNYADGPRFNMVKNFYYEQHTQQTYDFAVSRMKHYEAMDKLVLDPWTALEIGGAFTDDSDPDTDMNQFFHSFQVAEALRKAFPDEEKYGWLHLTGLIHDLGKILTPAFGEPQWSNVGDTFPVGCMFERVGVFPQFFDENPDSKHPVYSTQLGIYQPGCGLNNLTMSFSHDEYLYKILVHEKNATQITEKQLPIQAYYILRFHSFVPWFKHDAYTIFENEIDKENKEWVKIFAPFDLYSKSHDIIDIEQVKPYYQKLIKQYLPAKIYL